MDKVQTMGILSVLILAGAGIASAFPSEKGIGKGLGQGGAGLGQVAEGLGQGIRAGFGMHLDEEYREALHDAILNGDWETYSSILEEAGVESIMTEELFLQESDRIRQRDQIHQAMLVGDWDAYSSLIEQYGVENGLASEMTEEAFPLFSELANLREQAKEIRLQLSNELGFEEHMFRAKRGMCQMGFGIGRENLHMMELVGLGA